MIRINMKLKKSIALSDSGFLFNSLTGDSFSLNNTAIEIIKLLNQGRTDEEIIDHFTENYSVDKNTMEKDLYDYKRMLTNYKLIDN